MKNLFTILTLAISTLFAGCATTNWIGSVTVSNGVLFGNSTNFIDANGIAKRTDTNGFISTGYVATALVPYAKQTNMLSVSNKLQTTKMQATQTLTNWNSNPPFTYAQKFYQKDNPHLTAPLDVEWYGYSTNLVWDASQFVSDSGGDPYPYFNNVMTYGGFAGIEIGQTYEVQLATTLGYSEGNGSQTNMYATIGGATLQGWVINPDSNLAWTNRFTATATNGLVITTIPDLTDSAAYAQLLLAKVYKITTNTVARFNTDNTISGIRMSELEAFLDPSVTPTFTAIAVSNITYYPETTGGAITISLPSVLTDGQRVSVYDINNYCNSNNITVLFPGADDIPAFTNVMSRNGAFLECKYSTTAGQWIVSEKNVDYSYGGAFTMGITTNITILGTNHFFFTNGVLKAFTNP